MEFEGIPLSTQGGLRAMLYHFECMQNLFNLLIHFSLLVLGYERFLYVYY